MAADASSLPEEQAKSVASPAKSEPAGLHPAEHLTRGTGIARAPISREVHFDNEEALDPDTDLVAEDDQRGRETFLPITREALIDRLTRPQAWPPGGAAEARRFFRYLAYWRQQQHNAAATALDQTYEMFNPDSDLLMTRQFTDGERFAMRKRVVEQVKELLQQANFRRIDPSEVELILTKESHYGLDFTLDLEAFEELEIYFRGASTRKDQRRTLRKFFRKEEFDVPIFQRLFILFKLKSDAHRIEEVMKAQQVSRAKATKIVKKLRKNVPEGVGDGNIYLKLFKNMPRSDVEMIFPNTKVRFRLLDKIKLGAMSSGAVGFGIITSAGKIALIASNPIAALGALAGLGGAAFRQLMNFFNTRQKYMVVMAQNLYFHALADNRGVIMTLADRAADEDVKEEMLLYSVLSKETVRRVDLRSVDHAIEQYLEKSFGVTVDFDLEDALGRLLEDGLVREAADGTLIANTPREAAARIDELWDSFLDQLPDTLGPEGTEFEGVVGGAVGGPEARPKQVALDT